MSNTINSRLAGLTVGVLGVLLVIMMLAPAVSASSHVDFVIPIDTVVPSCAVLTDRTGCELGDEGDVVELVSQDVPEEFQGQSCKVKAVAQNQGSVHPNSDLRVDSGGSSVLLEDVEAVPGGTVEGDGTLVLGSNVIVSLIMGSDGVFSGGFDIEFDCTPPVPPSTTTTEATTTTTIPDEVSPTSIVSSTTTIVSTTAPEVSPTDETLPFTGAESGTPAALALVLIAGGALALVGAKGFRADTDE